MREDSNRSDIEKNKHIRNNIGDIIGSVKSLAILGFDTLWRILCSKQHEELTFNKTGSQKSDPSANLKAPFLEVLYQGEIFLSSVYFKLNVPNFDDQIIYEIFFEKIFMMMSLDDNYKSSCLHILKTFIELFRDIRSSLNSARKKKNKSGEEFFKK